MGDFSYAVNADKRGGPLYSMDGSEYFVDDIFILRIFFQLCEVQVQLIQKILGLFQKIFEHLGKDLHVDVVIQIVFRHKQPEFPLGYSGEAVWCSVMKATAVPA